VLSALKRLVSAAFKGSRRRKAVVILLIVGVLAAGAAVAIHEFADIDPVTGKRVASRTTYANPDGTYGRTVITYSDGTKREVRSDGSGAACRPDTSGDANAGK
jgi:hypothetical protein